MGQMALVPGPGWPLGWWRAKHQGEADRGRDLKEEFEVSGVSVASRSRVRARREREARQKRIAIAVFIGGLILLGVAAYLLMRPSFGSAAPVAAFDYGSEDVARAEPLVAEHEMGAGPPIPYLPASGPQPAIAVNQDFVNVGSVGPQDVVKRDFVIANNGEAPLTISRAYTTCGCTTAEISSATIPPGKVAEVTLIFDAGFHDTRGQVVRRGLILENNDPQHSTAEIWIQASVRSE